MQGVSTLFFFPNLLFPTTFPCQNIKCNLYREIREELGLSCLIHNLIDVWVYEVLEGKHVLIITYLCKCTDTLNVEISEEHSAFNWFSMSEIETVNIPKWYMDSIKKATKLR
ncbi:NUDIX domain-containing protein [Aneurinibacillus migulanus]|uniref:NUDIX domain-containing protein n=1 Tax=Aneurinibacillus migulanus TaxID=47500 RepID=UPI00399CEF52